MYRLIRRTLQGLCGGVSLLLALLVVAHTTSGSLCVNCGSPGGCPAGRCIDGRYDACLSAAYQSLVAPLRTGLALSNVPQPDSVDPHISDPHGQAFASVVRAFTFHVSIGLRLAWHPHLDLELTSAPLYLLLRQLRL